MRFALRSLLGANLLVVSLGTVWAQVEGSAGVAKPPSQGTADLSGTEQYARLEQELLAVSDTLLETQHQLARSEERLRQLRAELATARAGARDAPGTARTGANATESTFVAAFAAAPVEVAEEHQVLEAEIKQHEQTKVETTSKFPLRLYGLVLFNAFYNADAVDDIDLASVAIPQNGPSSQGSVGASVRQSILGLRAEGPHVFGAKSSADLSADLFSGIYYGYYGNSVGTSRLRRADVALRWRSDAVHVGVDSPLISPLSPTSYATIGLPAMAWAGNLWTWAPQLRYAHDLRAGEGGLVKLEGGLWDAPVVGINSDRVSRMPSAGELSRQPGFEGRVSYRRGSEDHPFELGMAGYSGRQSYTNQTIGTWAATADWQLPLGRHFSVEGEAYRGLGLGGFGGGAYKDVLTGVDRGTGLARTLGLNAVGGWAQVKARLDPAVEMNATFGQDDGLAADFHRLNLSSATNVLELNARNRMIVGNVIYRPKTYLIVSPEYRRIVNWQITGPASTANIFTMSFGYEF